MSDYPFIRFRHANPCMGLLGRMEQIIGESNLRMLEHDGHTMEKFATGESPEARLYCYPLSSGIGRKGGGFVFVNLKTQRAAFVTRQGDVYVIHTHKHNNPSQDITSWENVDRLRFPKTTLDSTKAALHILGFLTEGDE